MALQAQEERVLGASGMALKLTTVKKWIGRHRREVIIGGAVGTVILLAVGGKKDRCAPRLGSERYHRFDAFIDEAAARYHVERRFIRAVIRVESDFQPNCTSIVVRRGVRVQGARGLMQIMPGPLERCGLANPFDPRGNILCGTSILRSNLNRYHGDLELTLAAYNAGPGRAHDPPAATREYVSRVLSFYRAA
jgi:soluble lytic murein transglycosylase-like protein